MTAPSLASLRTRPVPTGLVLGAALVPADFLLHSVTLDGVPPLLFVAGVLLVLWGEGDRRLAGVAATTAGLAAVVLLELAASLGPNVLFVSLVVAFLALVVAVS